MGVPYIILYVLSVPLCLCGSKKPKRLLSSSCLVVPSCRCGSKKTCGSALHHSLCPLRDPLCRCASVVQKNLSGCFLRRASLCPRAVVVQKTLASLSSSVPICAAVPLWFKKT